MSLPLRQSTPFKGRGPWRGRGPFANKGPFGRNADYSFFQRRMFWSESAYSAAPGGRKTLMSVAVMTALGFTSSGGANGTIIGSDGTLQAATTPRITYDRGATSNLLTYSEDLSNAAWAGSGATATAVDRIVENNANGNHNVFQIGRTLVAQPTVWSGEAKAGARNWLVVNTYDGANNLTYFDLSTGKVGTVGSGASAAIQPAGNGWFKWQITRTPSATANGGVAVGMASADATQSYAGDNVSDIYVRKVNVGPTATYLKTTSTAPLYTAGVPKAQNLIPNTDLTSGAWVASSLASIVASSDRPPDGSLAWELTPSGGSTNSGHYIRSALNSVTDRTVYTYKLWIKCVSGTINGFNLGPVWEDNSATYKGDSGTTVNLTTTWQQVVIRGVASPGAQMCRFNFGGAFTWVAAAGGIRVGGVSLYEGTADLPQVTTAGTPYSLYYQRSIIRENAATRETLQPRDLTQAAWTKSGSMTAAKTATGTDGVANSSSTLTSGGTNQTCLQVVTSASATRAFSARIRSRSASSLTIDMTVDGGTTWNAVTVNAAFMPYSITQAAVTNPSYGFRLRGNGDAIDVDFVQGEQGSVATSPIWGTESAAQTRSADQDTSTNTPANAGTWCVSFTPNNPGSATAQTILKYGAAHLYVQSGSVKATDGTNTITIGTANANVLNTVALSWTGSTLAGSLNGAAAVSGSFTGTFGSGATVSVGSDAGSTPLVGEIGVWQAGSIAASIAQLASASAGMLA